MHPINNKNFGPKGGRLAVKFFDGSSVVTGYIVKQTGTNNFLVSKADGSGQKVCTLAQTTSELTALTAGTGADSAKRPTLCTVEIVVFSGGATENCRRIVSGVARTIQGTRCQFKTGVAGALAGDGTISVNANAAPTVANAVPNQTGTVAAIFSYVIPANTFADANGDVLTLSGQAIPAGFAFDPVTRILSKAAGASTVGAKTVTIRATDPGALFVDATFTVTLS